jgi:hypothetical protein
MSEIQNGKGDRNRSNPKKYKEGWTRIFKIKRRVKNAKKK